MSEFVASPERLIIGALLGFAVLLFLIIKVKIQPFIAIMSSALIIGLAVGMPFDMITDTIAEGVGTTLQTIAILIGLGSMFGAILQVSGGVEVIADTLLKVFGEKKAPWALGITGLIVGMPVFFESGLLILIPVAFGIARKTKKSVFCYSIPLLAGLAIGHAFVPPTPGPVLVAEMLNVELSYVIMLGIIIGIPAMILAGPVFGKFAGNKFHCEVPTSYLENEKEAHEKENGKRPNFFLIVSIILLPLFLIILNTLSSVIPFMKPVQPVLEFLGTPVIALLLSTICAMLFLGLPGGFGITEITTVMTNYHFVNFRWRNVKIYSSKFRYRRSIWKFRRFFSITNGAGSIPCSSGCKNFCRFSNSFNDDGSRNYRIYAYGSKFNTASACYTYNRYRSRRNSVQSCKRFWILAFKVII